MVIFPKKQLLDYLAFAGFRLYVLILRVLPLRYAIAFSGSLWRHFGPRFKRHMRALENFQASMLGISDLQAQDIILSMWDHLGRVFAETVRMNSVLDALHVRIGDQARLMLDELTHVRATSPSPVLFLSGHLGNWELMVPYFHHIGLARQLDVLGVYQGVQNPYIERFLLSLRARYYPAGLVKKSRSSARQLLAHVRRGGSLALLCDQRENKGIFIDFFGRPAPTEPFHAHLALRCHMPVYLVYMVRTGELSYVFDALRIDTLPFAKTYADNPDQGVLELTQHIHVGLQSIIAQWPEQWMWGHRRWG